MKECSLCQIYTDQLIKFADGSFVCLDCEILLTKCPECNHRALFDNYQCLNCYEKYVFVNDNISVKKNGHFIELFMNDNSNDFTIDLREINSFSETLKKAILKISELFEIAFHAIEFEIKKYNGI